MSNDEIKKKAKKMLSRVKFFKLVTRVIKLEA